MFPAEIGTLPLNSETELFVSVEEERQICTMSCLSLEKTIENNRKQKETSFCFLFSFFTRNKQKFLW